MARIILIIKKFVGKILITGSLDFRTAEHFHATR